LAGVVNGLMVSTVLLEYALGPNGGCNTVRCEQYQDLGSHFAGALDYEIVADMIGLRPG